MIQRIGIIVDSSTGELNIKEMPTIYQGSSSSYAIDFDYGNTLDENKDYYLYVSFRRKDGKSTAKLPVFRNGDIFSFLMDSSWYFDVVGDLTFCVELRALVNNVEQIVSSGYNVLTIVETPSGLFTPSPLAPSAYDTINSEIASAKNRLTSAETSITNLKNANMIKSIKDKDEATIDKLVLEATHYDGTKEDIEIKLPSGLATEDEVDDKISTLQTNEINPIKTRVTNLEDEDISIKTRVEALETETATSVHYEGLEDTEEVGESILNATNSTNDSEGNKIVDTYATKIENRVSREVIRVDNHNVLSTKYDYSNKLITDDNGLYLVFMECNHNDFQEDVGANDITIKRSCEDVLKTMGGFVSVLYDVKVDTTTYRLIFTRNAISLDSGYRTKNINLCDKESLTSADYNWYFGNPAYQYVSVKEAIEKLTNTSLHNKTLSITKVSAYTDFDTYIKLCTEVENVITIKEFE